MNQTWNEMTPEQSALKLAELDLAQEVLDGFAEVMREWQATSRLSPAEWGRHVWRNSPTLADADGVVGRYLDCCREPVS